MRKWCVTIAMGALLALPLYAQKKDDGKSYEKERTSVAGESSGKAASPVALDLFGVPAAPRATPFAAPAPKPDIFSDWANNAWNRGAWGQLTPRYEVAGMYDYINFSPGDPFNNFNVHGGSGSFTYNVSKWLGPPLRKMKMQAGSRVRAAALACTFSARHQSASARCAELMR